jgi:PfaD family protein
MDRPHFQETNAQAQYEAVKHALAALDRPCYLVRGAGAPAPQVKLELRDAHQAIVGYCAPIRPSDLGSRRFREVHGVRYAYQAGAMANGIASESLVVALGREGILSCFGSAGLSLSRVASAIERIQRALPNGPYAFNLIHSPAEPALERGNVDLYLRHRIRCVEASAYLGLTPHVVRYRVAGLRRDASGATRVENRVIAKVSRPEVALPFMQPAPERMLRELQEQGAISAEQVQLARSVPMADDITIEADSGGHTDNRPWIALVPLLLGLRAETQARYHYDEPLRIGVAGGIGTPEAVFASFALGADYVVTGSINQACIQAGTSETGRKLLAQAEIADFAMAPAADMFEMGVKLQVLKRGTLFPMRANTLHELYKTYDSWQDIPLAQRTKVEQQLLRASFDQIWQQCVTFFSERDPVQLQRAEGHPKRRMALVFRWYLGMSSRWANDGEPGREADYQLWAGPAIGSFNQWVKGSYLADFTRRDVRDVAEHLMHGAAYLGRVHALRAQGVELPLSLQRYAAVTPLVSA